MCGCGWHCSNVRWKKLVKTPQQVVLWRALRGHSWLWGTGLLACEALAAGAVCLGPNSTATQQQLEYSQSTSLPYL